MRAFPILVVLSLAACSGDNGGVPGDVGICVHEYREPILTLRSATSTPSGASLSKLVLGGFTLDGAARTAQDLATVSSGIVVGDDGTLECTLPCAFGRDAGRYAFTASADGHRDTAVSADAVYATLHGGCPSYNDDGSTIDVQLPVR